MAACASLVGGVLAAQVPDTARAKAPTTAPARSFLTERVRGDAQLFTEVYGASGIAARRPGTTLRFLASPQLRLIGSTEIGVDVIASNEGTSVRQQLSQFALAPSWGWGRLYLGDFSRDLSPYTVQGIRIRGAGLDLTPGALRFSVQGGTSQQALPATTIGPTYQRSLVAGAVGVGREERSYVEVLVVGARDALVAADLPLIDTLGVDTLDLDQRPQQINRPQENVVGGVRGAARLFKDAVAFRGEVATGLFTRDREAAGINTDSLGAVPGDAVTPNVSSSLDLAFNGELAVRGRAWNLRGGWEQVGAGFTSLGVGFLVNDRRALNAGGDVRLLRGGLMLSGRWQGQRDNLSGQRRFTTGRQTVTASAIARLGTSTLSLAGLVNTAGNDAENDTLRVDNRTLSTQVAWQLPYALRGHGGSVAFSYALQQTEDANPLRRIPQVTVHSLAFTPTVPLTDALQLTPTVSAVLTDGGDAASAQRNVLAGLRANAKLGGGRVTSSGQYTRSFTAARPVTMAMWQAGARLPWDLQFTVQARWNRYGAIGARPGFEERFATTSVGRSF
jgi:hypothetical protein